MKSIAIITIALLLQACANVTASSPRAVTVKAGAALTGEAQKLADAECAKHGRYARFSAKTSMVDYVFDCVQ